MCTYYTYEKAGVSTPNQDLAMKMILPLFEDTFKNRKGKAGESLLSIKHYAAIIQITKNIAMALKTDGVGTKTFIAQYMNKYDTVGIDCVAMNVNDIICTGAEPTSFLDYLAIQKADPQLIHEIAKGLKKGADMAKVSIVGGETAILPDMINGPREGRAFDLAGMSMGIINPTDIIDGSKVAEGDVLIGISSSGVHSNGYTLARKILLGSDKLKIDTYVDELGRTLGEELLEPTSIYVDEIMTMMKSQINLKLVAHITSDGLFNLLRLSTGIGYKITNMPEPQPIFKLLKKYGKIPDTELYFVYNMGIGMCIVVPKNQADSAMQIIEKFGKKAFVMGHATRDSNKTIKVEPIRIHGSFNDKTFHQY